jgi:hypothetical protein
MIPVIKQFLINGVQDKDIKKRITCPFVINIPKRGDATSQINFREYGDLIKIKGFIVKKTDLQILNDKKLIIEFGDSKYEIPFSFLLSMNKIENDNNTFFIEFPHNYLLNHHIPIIFLQFSSFKLKIGYIQYLDIKLVIESTFLDVIERKKIASNIDETLYNFRCIEKFELYLFGATDNPYNINIFTSKIDPVFLCQGIIINYPKKFINKLIISSDFGDQKLIIMKYNEDLTQIYGCPIGFEQKLTYYGFNLEENYQSNNLVGCVNMSKLDNVIITVELKENEDYDTPNDLIIYLSCFNTIRYKNGLCCIVYS